MKRMANIGVGEEIGTPYPPDRTNRRLFDQPYTPQQEHRRPRALSIRSETDEPQKTHQFPPLLPQNHAKESIELWIANYKSGTCAKELATLVRLYNKDEFKYKGTDDSFDLKFNIYLNHCK